MPVSFSVPLPVFCVHCDAEAEQDVFTIISSVDRSDLIEQVRLGTYPDFTCRNCGRASPIDTPVLIHRPEQGGLAGLIYSPSYVMTAEQSAEAADGLVTILFSNLGVSGRNVQVPIFIVHRLSLPAVLSRDVRKDLATPPDRLRLPPDLSVAYSDMLAHLRPSAE